MTFLLLMSTDSIKSGAYDLLNYCSVRNRECTQKNCLLNSVPAMLAAQQAALYLRNNRY